MSKRVSASAPALPIDGPDLDHVAKPLNFLDGSDVSHGLNGHNGDAGTKSVLARSQTKPTKSVALVKAKKTKSVPLTTCFTTKHVGAIIALMASQNPAPHAGALESQISDNPTIRPEASAKSVQRKFRSTEMPPLSALEAEDSTKSASPVLAKAYGPKVPKQRNTLFRPKPASILPDLPEIYGMRTDGDCMVPEILDGQKIIVSKTEEVKRGDTVCLWLKSQSRPEGYSALVKRVAMLPPPHVTFPFVEHPESEIEALVFVEQINPPRTYRFKCEDVLAMHKVIGVQSDREG